MDAQIGFMLSSMKALLSKFQNYEKITTQCSSEFMTIVSLNTIKNQNPC